MGILDKLDEKPLRDIGDSTLSIDIAAMNEILQQLTDDCICNMQENQTKRSITLNKLYADLVHVLHYFKPNLIADVSLRMVQLTLSKGITPEAPKAFALYGEVLASMGNISEGCRLGKFVLQYTCILFILLESNILLRSYITYPIYYDCIREIGTQAGRERSMYEVQAIGNCGGEPIHVVVY
jgi:hypothetical protein